MSCNCAKTKPLNSCTTNLFVGSYSANTEYTVLLETADGRTDVYTETTSNTGALVIHPTLRTNTLYTGYLISGYSSVDFTIDGTDYECVYISAKQQNTDGDISTTPDAILTLE